MDTTEAEKKVRYKYRRFTVKANGGDIDFCEGKTQVKIDGPNDHYLIPKTMKDWERYSDEVMDFLRKKYTV